MKLFNRSNFCLLIALIVFSAGFGLSSETYAQKKRKTPTPQPVRTNPQTQSPDVPEVISRANEYLTTEQIINPQPQTEPQNEALAAPEVSENERLTKQVKELNSRIKSLEGGKQNQYDEKQKRLLLNMDILTRAEQRADALRKQLFEVIDKESSLQTRLDQLTYDLRPEILERSSAFSGSLRPEEIRDTRRKSLESEKRNLENLLLQIQNTRSSLELNVQKADQLVEKVRYKLEKEIDEALDDEKPQPDDNQQ